MLKSLFEASIDRLNIPVDMKTAIKEINNVCLEAEGDNKPDPNEQWKFNAFPENKGNAAPNAAPTNNAPKKTQADLNKQWNFSGLPEQPSNQKDFVPEGKQACVDPAKPMTGGPLREAKPFKNLTAEEAKNFYTVNQDNSAQAAPAQTAQAQPAEQQPAEQTNAQATAEQSNQASNTEQQPQAQSENNGEQQAQANANPAAPKYRKGADVATVQFFIRSRHPETELVGDGILGPKTIQAIQKVEDLEETGKMDQATQQAFNDMLKEAKVKVKELQEKLGVTADGLIGKQTLAAMNKANMNVANLFSTQPSNEAYASKQTTPANTAENPTDKKLTSHPFNKERADSLLQQKSITQQAYNIWKNFGIAPLMQKKMPNETKAFIARAQQQKKNEANAATTTKGEKTPGNQASNGNVTPQNDEEKKFYEGMKKNYLKVYQASAKQKGKSELWASNMADNAAKEALAKKRNGTWGKAAEQGNQQAAQNGTKQPAQQGNQQQAATPQKNNQNDEVYHTMKDSKGTTEYYSGNISWANLSPEEKKIKEDAEAKEQAKYYDGKQVKKNPKTGKPYDEQIVYNRIQSAGQNAVIKNRMAKARERQAASGKQG